MVHSCRTVSTKVKKVVYDYERVVDDDLVKEEDKTKKKKVKNEDEVNDIHSIGATVHVYPYLLPT